MLYMKPLQISAEELDLTKFFSRQKFLDAGIQDVSTSISIVYDLIEISPDEEDEDGDESDKHMYISTRS